MSTLYQPIQPVLYGGAWLGASTFLMCSAYRITASTDYKYFDTGFRITIRRAL